MAYLKVEQLNRTILWLSLFGFPFVAAISFVSSTPSTPLSILMRGVIVVLGIIVLVKFSRFGFSLRYMPVWALALFSVMYCMRILIDGTDSSYELSRPPWVFSLFFLGGCVVPAMTLASGKGGIGLVGWDIFCKRILLYSPFVLVCLILAGNYSFEAEGGYIVETDRLGFQALNPIFAGHFAVSIMLVCYFRGPTVLRNTFLERFFLHALMCLAAYCAVLAASRGPVIAGFLAFIIICYGVQRALVIIVGLALLLGVFFFDQLNILAESSPVIVNRLLLSLNTIETGEGRIAQYLSGLELFRESPFFGARLEDPRFGIYPHNIFIEVLMSTGLVGGAAFAFICITAVRRALNFRKVQRIGNQVVGALFLQYLFAAQFSGSIYTSTALWALLGILCNPQFSKRINENRNYYQCT